MTDNKTDYKQSSDYVTSTDYPKNEEMGDFKDLVHNFIAEQLK